MKVVKITASWCMSCIIMNQTLKEVEEKHKLNYESLKLDYDLDKEEIEKYNIGKILPVYIKLDENNNEIGRLIGEHKPKEVLDFLKDGGYIND